jgi:hypothetical protein
MKSLSVSLTSSAIPRSEVAGAPTIAPLMPSRFGWDTWRVGSDGSRDCRVCVQAIRRLRASSAWLAT